MAASGRENELLWKSEPQSESFVSVTLTRSITSLLSSRPNKLHDSISRLSSHSPSPTTTASLHDSLFFFHSFATDTANHNRSLDQLLVPIIHSSLKCKDSKHGGQALILLNWLFQDELIFVPVAEALASIITRNHDRYLLFGWCLLLRSLVDYESSVHQSMLGGIRDRYVDLLKILSTRLPDLAGIVSKESILQDGFELPSRLGVSAADCFLAISGALTKEAKLKDKKSKFNKKAKDQGITVVQCLTIDKKVKSDSKSLLMSKFEREYTLWHHIDDLICLVQRLHAWSKKSRFLHAKGLEQVLKWLEEIKDHYGSFQPEADSNAFKTGDLLLSSCWKHYYLLLHLEDRKFSQCHKELLDQYLSGIQYYMDNHASGSADNKDGGLETTKFFLNCLCLLLGRLDSKRFESTMSEIGMKISRILVPQLNCTDEDVIVGVVSIFKVIILKPNHSQEEALVNSRQANTVIPFLLHLLDEQDGTSRAVVMLIAEYCSISKDDMCLMEVLKRLGSENISQRRNAMDVIAEILHISSESKNSLPYSAWQKTADTLLERLGDEDIRIREQASKLLPMIDPSLYLPALVRLIYSSDENQSSASNAIIGVLKGHSQNIEIIFLLVDSLNNISQSLDLPQSAGDKESKLDTARVLKLVPEWSKSVQDWNNLIGPLIDKMFADPSNAAIVKLFSYISEDLANVVDLVLHHVLLHVRELKGRIDESFLSKWECRTYTSGEYDEMQRTLFDHLCPLLIVKMLPMKTFDDLSSSVMYGRFSQNKMLGSRSPELDHECIASFLLSRALCEFEFEDVRKLSAELCGRIHPQVLFPVICSKLELSVDSKNVLKIKTCLFSICTSLMVRGWESLSHPLMHAIKRMVETVLLWPCLNADSVSKVQHGCIDCLALMICVELQAEESITDSTSDRVRVIGKKAAGDSIVTYVMNQFFNDKKKQTSNPEFGENCESVAAVPLSFRLCMGNVLISTCQKLSEPCKKHFAAQVLPFLIDSLKFELKSEIRAACIQVLFSAVYHLRSAVLPYAYDLLKISLKALRKESGKERMAGAKLIASLMASEDVILETISVGLLEARSVLSTVSSSDHSPELRQLCQKLLACISSP
ncbi:uncharacterized protein LOC131610375 isoform X1 [Vicia villosa]|uniref:uncharacterized protein LOC131610375 isoform X1 n=2 Tax=Vicia villosa TaxID=3911 RepID=UPI00273B45B6|nr:uncharacterized protein LOC131610375 isoform X1 [Vicia villosa]